MRLKHVDGLERKDVAEALGLSEKAVKKAIEKGNRICRDLYARADEGVLCAERKQSLQAVLGGTPTDADARQNVEALAHALRLTPTEWDCLLFAADYVPPSLQKLGPHDSTVAAITRLLADDRLSSASRADFRAVVETVAARWQPARGDQPPTPEA